MILLFTKEDGWSYKAARIAKDVFGEDKVHWYRGKVGDPFPEDVHHWGAKTVLSFLSPWIIPKSVLDKADVALNWHPGPREYPGIGCYNFALYNGTEVYGATCHFMEPTVDTGAIVEERVFPTFPHDTVESLKLRTMAAMLAMFLYSTGALARGLSLHRCGEEWFRRPYIRRELDELGRVTPDMSAEEVARRVRAMRYPGYPGAFVEIGGRKFYHD